MDSVRVQFLASKSPDIGHQRQGIGFRVEGEPDQLVESTAPAMATSSRKKKTAARIGGLALHAFGDSAAIAKRARSGFEAKFQRQAIGIDPSLHGDALEHKVRLFRNLYFAKLAAKSVKARSKKRNRRGH